jgi:hypothetical protein
MGRDVICAINQRNRAFWDGRHCELWQQISGGTLTGDAELERVPAAPGTLHGTIRSSEHEAHYRHIDVREAELELSKEPTVKELKSLGVTEDQLKTARFSSSNHGQPFESWSWRMNGKVPYPAIPLMQRYCTLRWLLLNKPPPSRNRDAAYEYLAAAGVAPLVAIGLATKAAQRLRASKPRAKAEDGRPIREIVEELVVRSEYKELSAAQLWRHFQAALDEQGLMPKEIDDSTKRHRMAIEYEGWSRRRRISFRRFAAIVSEVRGGKSR